MLNQEVDPFDWHAVIESGFKWKIQPPNCISPESFYDMLRGGTVEYFGPAKSSSKPIFLMGATYFEFIPSSGVWQSVERHTGTHPEVNRSDYPDFPLAHVTPHLITRPNFQGLGLYQKQQLILGVGTQITYLVGSVKPIYQFYLEIPGEKAGVKVSTVSEVTSVAMRRLFTITE